MKNLLKNLLLMLTLCGGTQLFALTEDEQALFDAAEAQSFNIAKKLIDKGTNINIKKDGQTLINAAIGNMESPEEEDLTDELDLAKYLIEKGANIDIQNKSGDTPLMKAIYLNYTNFAQYLPDKGADVNLKNFGEISPLDQATFDGKENIIKTLLFNNATFSIDDSIYKNALKNTTLKSIFDEIISYKNDNSKEALVKAINNKDTTFTKHEWLTFALLNGHHKQIQYAIDQKIFTPFEILEGLSLQPRMPLDIFNSLWDQLKDDNLEAKLIKVAKENKNETFLDAVSNYKIKTKVLTGKYTKNKNIFVAPEIAKNITSFSDTSFEL